MSIKEDNILTKAINKKISRRSFIKWSSALGATASMSGLVMQTGAKVAGAAHTNVPATGVGGSIVDWKPSCCLVCHSWCHIAAGVDANGHVRKIEGAGGQPKKYADGTTPVACHPLAATLQGKSDDANHVATPAGYLAYAPHNKGRICAKGNDGVEHLYDPDRIKYPLERIGARGEGKWRRVTWDYALGRIADKLRTIAQAGNQHRLAVWVGRNEHFSPKTFSAAYGTPNHVEHTSLCELSRHAAGRSLWGHHWSSIDLQEHTGITVAGPGWGDGELATLTLDRDEHDADCYIEWGGNPAEAKIPHTTCANHMGDRRRSNLVGFDGGGRLGRIINIDVRQSNTGAFADENFQITPGSDGALALGIFYGVLDTRSTQVRQDLDRGHNGTVGGKTDGEGGYDAENRRYYGIFAAEEAGGLASGSSQAAVPAGESLESYLFELGGRAADDSFYDHIGATTNDWAGVKTAVAGITGLDETDVQYLTDLLYNGNGIHKNVLIDGYRGPCKHTNGTYNYRAIRALQFIAPNASSATFYPAATAQTVARGGYNAPGGFMSDNNWDPYGNGGGAPSANGADAGIPAVGGTAGYAFGKNTSLPPDQGVGADDAAPSDIQRIDNWDYELDLGRWRGSYKWVDQNFNCGIRHSLGLNAFTVGALADASINGPYNSADPNFKIEALLWHKNSPTYSRPNQDAEIEMMTATDGSGQYLLENTWAIDIAMGDGTRFADIILPDVSYLERYSERSGEGQEYNWRPNLFYRVPVYEVDGPTIDTEVVPRHIYDTRQVSAIFYELARTIEPIGNGGAYSPVGPWNGSLYDTFRLSSADTGSVQENIDTGVAYVNDGEWARREMVRTACNGVTSTPTCQTDGAAAGAADGFDFMMSHAMIWGSNDDPAYWRGHFRGDKGESNGTDSYAANNGFGMAQTTAGASDVRENGGKFTVYNTVLATMPDIADGVDTAATRNDGSGHFYGVPVYNPIFTQTSSNFPRHLTTYKLNVHTQSRTACLPRLNEIIGNSWAVLPADGFDGSGSYCNADDGLGRKIRNGEVVTIISSAGTLECVAKVTEKAQSGCVHISTSQGHQAGIYTVDADAAYLNPNREAFGTYLVDGSVGRDIDRTLNNPAGSPADDYAVNDVPPSAPGKGTHPNKIIEHHLTGGATGANYNTDPLGGSQGWFDTKVRVY